MTFGNTLYGYGLAFLYALLNILGQLLIKEYLYEIPSTLLLFMRIIVIFTFTILCIAFSSNRFQFLKANNLLLQIVRGVVFATVSFFRYKSLEYIPLVIYVSIALSERIIVVLISLFLGNEKEYKSLFSIVTLNIISIFAIKYSPVALEGYNIGILLALFANILCAFSGYITAGIHKNEQRGINTSLTTALYTSFIAMVILPAFIFLFDNKAHTFLSTNNILNIIHDNQLCISILCILGIATQYLSINIFKYIDPNIQSSIGSITVVIGAIHEYTSGKSEIQIITYLGILGIMISMLLIFRRDYLKTKNLFTNKSSNILTIISLITIIILSPLYYKFYNSNREIKSHIGCGCCS